MLLKEFIEQYNENTTDSARSKFLKENLQVAEYVGFNNKLMMAERIVDATTFDRDIEQNKTGAIKISSVSRTLLTTLTIIDMYTNIDINFMESGDEYDALICSGILEKLIGSNDKPGMIPMREIAEFNALVNMVLDDVLQNNFTTQAYISNQVDRFGRLSGVLLSPILEKLNDTLENMDDATIEKLGKNLEKALKRIK